MSHLGTERTPSGEDEAERGNSCPETEGKSHNLVLFKLNKKSSKRRCCCKCEREHGPNEELSIGDLYDKREQHYKLRTALCHPQLFECNYVFPYINEKYIADCWRQIQCFFQCDVTISRKGPPK